MADASRVRGGQDIRQVVTAAVAAGKIRQLRDGSGAVLLGQNAAASGDTRSFHTEGQFTCTKTSGFVGLDGGKAFWDYSANAVYYKKVDDRDFYLGRFVGDSAPTDTTCVVNLGVNPRYDIDLHLDPALTVLVGTPAALAVSFNYPRRLGGSNLYYLSATSEAQKVDLISTDGFAAGGAKAIIEFAFRVPVGGSGTASDYSLGIASATHASDADSIAQHMFIHLDGGGTTINAQSKDGTTTVTATDTTKTFTAGTTASVRKEVWFDLRDMTSAKIYIDGVRVLSGTTFGLSAAASTWYLLTHLEKSTGTETADLIVDWMRARFAEQ